MEDEDDSAEEIEDETDEYESPGTPDVESVEGEVTSHKYFRMRVPDAIWNHGIGHNLCAKLMSEAPFWIYLTFMAGTTLSACSIPLNPRAIFYPGQNKHGGLAFSPLFNNVFLG